MFASVFMIFDLLPLNYMTTNIWYINYLESQMR